MKHMIKKQEHVTYALCEAVADLAWNFALANVHPGDSRDVTRLCIGWAEEFERKWHGHEWGVDEGPEYLEAIDAWFEEKYSAWLEIATDTHRNDMLDDKFVAQRAKWAAKKT